MAFGKTVEIRIFVESNSLEKSNMSLLNKCDNVTIRLQMSSFIRLYCSFHLDIYPVFCYNVDINTRTEVSLMNFIDVKTAASKWGSY